MPTHVFMSAFISLAFCTAVTGTAQEAEPVWTVGDESLTLRIARSDDGRIMETCRVDEVDVPYQGAPAAVRMAGQGWETLDVAKVIEKPTSLRLEGQGKGLAWSLTYEVTGPGMVTKTLVLKPLSDVVLEQVAPAAFAADPAQEIVSTRLQDIAAFCRAGDRSVFVSLDFPWSRITKDKGVTRVTYPPYAQLKAGQDYVCHSLTLGAAHLSSEIRYGRDTGEVQAMDRYVQLRRPQRFEHPMFVSASINNRYTMPRAGMVWYTYKDHPTLSFHTDLLKRELDLMSEIGMEYYQVFPGIFDWVPADPDPNTVHEIVKYGNARGVRIGDYSGCNDVFCAHYNEHSNRLDRPEWLMKDPAGNTSGFCFGCPEFVEYYINTVVPAARKFGFKIHCLDFLSLAPCFADHGHPTGDAGVYHQVAGLVHFMDKLASIDSKIMVWSNSGNWAEFLPKIAWHNPNLYLTDPFIATPWQGLNMTRLLDDARREQMVALHHTHFMPYRHYTNCQYFFSQNSIVPDIRDNYQYGVLASVAITPNLCLAEIRPWMDRLPERRQREVKAFYRRWTLFLRNNYALWTRTHHFGDNPGPGGIEIYGHADGDHGYIFIVNPNYWCEAVEVPLDERLGFSGAGTCEIHELHPVERLVLTSQGPTPAYSKTLVMEAPAQQVRVLEVRPAPRLIDSPRLYGVPGAIEASGRDWLLRTSGPQGVSHRFAVRMPDGTGPVTAAAVRTDVPKQAKRLYAETPLTILGQDGPYTLFEITYRRTAAPTELRKWKVQAADAAAGEAQGWTKGLSAEKTFDFPLFIGAKGIRAPVDYAEVRSAGLGPIANFCGGYVDNAFSEDQQTWIDLKQGSEQPASANASAAVSRAEQAVPDLARTGETSWWLQADFHLPFMYTIGAEPAFDEHAIMVLPMLDPSRVKELRAWVNGVPLEVSRYAFPRNRGLFTYWADLVGSGAHGGENVLVVYVEFAEE